MAAANTSPEQPRFLLELNSREKTRPTCGRQYIDAIEQLNPGAWHPGQCNPSITVDFTEKGFYSLCNLAYTSANRILVEADCSYV